LLNGESSVKFFVAAAMALLIADDLRRAVSPLKPPSKAKFFSKLRLFKYL
jgi:hypothetical protein